MRATVAGRFRWLLVVLACCGSDATAAAPAALTGSPPFVRIVPDVDADPQNFALVQDSRGIVYVGNGSGVLEYDGERWTRIPLANRDVVRSLALAADDRVYVGGYNTVGYLQADAGGHVHIVDLTPRFASFVGDREFGDVWDTVVAPEGVYFRALRDVFFWDPSTDRVSYWHREQRFGAIIHYRDQTILQFRDEGFRVRQGDDWIPIEGTGHFRNLIYDLVPLADGGLLTSGVDGDWWRLLDGPPRPLALPASLPASSGFDHSLALADGSLALASREGSVYILDPTLKTERHFQLDSGYLSGIASSIDGGFIVASDEAIYRVDWPSNWSMLGAEHGAEGSLERLARWNDSDYLISSAGVFRIMPKTDALPKFEHVPWGDLLAHDLVGIDASRALLAENYTLRVVEGDQAREISSELVYPRELLASRFRPGRIYVGTENGLRYVDVSGRQVSLSPAPELSVERSVIDLLERSANELWFGTARHGLWQVLFDDVGGVRLQRHWGTDDGLRLGVIPNASIVELTDGSLVASTNEGFFELRGERFVETELGGLAALRHPEELLQLVQADDGELWAYGNRRLFHRQADGRWQEAPLRELLRGTLIGHSADANGHARFVASQSLLLHNGNDLSALAAPIQVLLRSVTRIWPDGRREPLALYPEVPTQLDVGDYAIEFRFALPELARVGSHAYQARLLGYEGAWSEWSETRGYTYSRLRAGSYALEVRARDSNGRISAIPPFALIIVPPWYARWWAWVLWGLLGLAVLGWSIQLAIRRRVAKLAAQTERLESLVAERTRDLASANERLETMAHLDGLTGISNRRRLDHYLKSVWDRDGVSRRPIALLAIDVDHFKRYNDTHGHLAGDQMLKDLVQCMAPCLRRAEDMLARYGGEEFIAVLPGADLATARAIAEHMRQAVEAAALGSTISIGIASRRVGDGSIAELLEAADQALYAAKRNGRNRVMLPAA